MARKERKKGACKTTTKVTGNRVTIKTICPVKTKIVKQPCAPRKKYTKRPVPRTPRICKGLKGRSKKECIRISRKQYYIK